MSGKSIDVVNSIGQSRPWRAKVRDAGRKDDAEFYFCVPSCLPPDLSRPLLVIVHPGDAIEDGVGYSEGEEKRQVIEFGRKNVLGMAAEIDDRLATHDVVILHRESSLYTFMRPDFGRISKVEAEIAPYSSACLRASEVGSVLYGDDLEAAGEWMLENLDAADRSGIFMVGAYACAKMGCITALGRALQDAGCTNIVVSEHAPTDNCNDSPRWNPQETAAKAPRLKR